VFIIDKKSAIDGLIKLKNLNVAADCQVSTVNCGLWLMNIKCVLSDTFGAVE
jgi:hypothetical protein